jgi:hypothetical protein
MFTIINPTSPTPCPSFFFGIFSIVNIHGESLVLSATTSCRGSTENKRLHPNRGLPLESHREFELFQAAGQAVPAVVGDGSQPSRSQHRISEGSAVIAVVLDCLTKLFISGVS